MQYTAVTRNHRFIEVFDGRQQNMGSLNINLWQSKRAHISLTGGGLYYIEPTGFWLNKMVVSRNNYSYATIWYTWPRAQLIIYFANGTSLAFHRKNILNITYEALNDAGEVIASIQPVFTLKSLNFNYEIQLQDDCADDETMQLLPFLLTFCSKQLRIPGYHGGAGGK